MSGIDLEGWATILGTWILVVGTLAFAYWQLRQAGRLHSATTILDLRERFYSGRMRHARRDLARWFLKTPGSTEIENFEVGVFFELMGHLTRRGVLERRMVWSAFGTWITTYYLHFTQPVNLLQQWRKESNDPLILAEFEWLALRMLEYESRLAPGSSPGRTPLEDAREILENEAQLDDSHALD